MGPVVKTPTLDRNLNYDDLLDATSKGSMSTVVTTTTPDGNLNYNDLLGSTSKLFHKLYPDYEFFPETINTDSLDKLDDDGDLLES